MRSSTIAGERRSLPVCHPARWANTGKTNTNEKEPRRVSRGVKFTEIEERKMPKGLKAVSRDLLHPMLPSAEPAQA